MIGITMDELQDLLLNGHEAEFVYKDCEYSIETENCNGSAKIKIWKCLEQPICIAESDVSNIDELAKCFDIKCFDGKSFYEIEKDVVIDSIF